MQSPVLIQGHCTPSVFRWGFDMKILLHIIVAVLLGSCGQRNLFDCDVGYAKSSCSERTKDENARVALDDNDYDTAITLLSELISADPSGFERYPLLSAAYAARSGFDVFNVVSGNFGGSNSILQVMSSFLPTPTSRGDRYDASLTDMALAVSTLLDIPPERRSSTSGDKYAASAVIQLTIYQAAYGVMLLNKYTYGPSGYDPSRLSTMTAADATAILAAFVGSAAASNNGAGAAASTAISAISAQPGATDQERLAAWSQAAR